MRAKKIGLFSFLADGNTSACSAELPGARGARRGGGERDAAQGKNGSMTMNGHSAGHAAVRCDPSAHLVNFLYVDVKPVTKFDEF